MKTNFKTRKIIKCQGDGQGSCKRCKELGRAHINWTTFLYKIEGLEGVYCYSCVSAIQKEGGFLYVQE